MSDPRRIKVSFEKVNQVELLRWLKANKVKFKLIPNEPGKDGLGNLIFLIEVYSARHETAIRIKWETI